MLRGWSEGYFADPVLAGDTANLVTEDALAIR